MNLTYKYVNEQVVLVVEGTIDSETSAEFLQESEKMMTQSSGKLIYDFSRVKYVSSVGIQAIYTLLEKLEKQQRGLLLFGVTPNVMRVFKIVSLNNDIPIVTSEAEALAQK